MTTRADRREPGEARMDRDKFPGVSRPGLTTLKGVSISTKVADSTNVRDLAVRTQAALDELVVVLSRRLNELSVYIDQTGAQKRDVG
jgi:hypothetical protein